MIECFYIEVIATLCSDIYAAYKVEFRVYRQRFYDNAITNIYTELAKPPRLFIGISSSLLLTEDSF